MSGKSQEPTIEGYLQKRCITIMETADKETVLNTLVDSMKDSENVHDVEALRKGIFHRETLMSTGIGMGIAIPHVRLDSVDDLTISVAVVREGVEDYQSLDDETIRLVFMMAAHSEQHARYLKMLSKLSAILKDEKLRDKLVHTTDADDFYEILVSSEEK